VSAAPPGTTFDTSGNVHGLLVGQTSAQATATATALASSPDPSAAGKAVTYTATVSPAPDGGTVAFTDGTTAIPGCGAQPVSSTTGQATQWGIKIGADSRDVSDAAGIVDLGNGLCFRREAA
jgi:hypothetical protein